MSASFEILSYGDAKVFGCVNGFEGVAMKDVVILDGCFLVADVDDFTLVRMEFHLPLCFPVNQSVQVVLQESSVSLGFDGEIGDGVICKQVYCRIKAFAYIVDVEKKQGRSEN